MAVNTKAIKGRMKSISNTKKITKALEMVSAAKMRRAVDAALRTRAYATLAKEVLDQLSQIEEVSISLLDVRPVKRVLLIYITSNRGLCGSFNANVFKKTAQTLAQKDRLVMQGNPDVDAQTVAADVQFDVIGIGKKSSAFAKKMGLNLTSVFDTIGEKPTFEQLIPISKLAIDGFKHGTYDKVFVSYTNFKSSIVQEATVRQILPVTKMDVAHMLEEVSHVSNNAKVETDFNVEGYLFEPNRTQVLEMVLPRLVEVQLYQALLESVASEHSARMVAMKNATEAAKDMLSSLQLSFNKARQAAITQEISEIVGGAAALE